MKKTYIQPEVEVAEMDKDVLYTASGVNSIAIDLDDEIDSDDEAG